MTAARHIFIAFIVAISLICAATSVQADSAKDIDRDARQALEKLYKNNDTALSISKKAKAVLIFPKIVKAGLVFGGSYGEGALINEGKTEAYYSSASASWGLQAGAQSYGYALFLMTDKAMEYVRKTKGWEVGVGPTVVIVDSGAAKNLSNQTLKDDAYGFIFGQQGLMAGISLEGSKVTKIKR